MSTKLATAFACVLVLMTGMFVALTPNHHSDLSSYSQTLSDANKTLTWCSQRMLPKATPDDVNALRCAIGVEPAVTCPLVVFEMADKTKTAGQAFNILSISNDNSLKVSDWVTPTEVFRHSETIDGELVIEGAKSSCLHCPKGSHCSRAVVRLDTEVWTLPCKGDWHRGEP